MYSVTLPTPRIRNGAGYYELLNTPTTSHLTTATINDKEKLEFQNSFFTVDLVTHSYKYGMELQFKSWTTTPPKVKPRVDKEHGYYRLECGYLPGSHETAEKLREIADQIDMIIGYSEPIVEYSSRPRREIKSLLDVLI